MSAFQKHSLRLGTPRHEQRNAPVHSVSLGLARTSSSTGCRQRMGPLALPAGSGFWHCCSMEKITNVFVPVSGLEAHERAVAVGAAMARRLGTSLSLVEHRAPNMLFHSDERYLKALAAEQHVPEVVTALSTGGDLAAWMVEKTQDPNQLVCMAAAPHQLVVPGSVTAAVLRFAAHPVLMVGPAVSRRWTSKINTVVVPVDGSKSAEKAVEVAAKLASALHAELRIIQVIELADAFLVKETHGDVLESSYVRVLAESVGHETNVTWEVLHGKPGPAIVDCVSLLEHPIVVMSPYGNSGGQHVLGSVTHRVMHASAAPVLVTRP